MRRAVIVLALLAGVASADDGGLDEDPKDALVARGLVFGAGKGKYVVIVPVAEQPSSMPAGAHLKNAAVYVGTTKKLTRVGTWSWNFTTGEEELGLLDPWELYNAHVIRAGSAYRLTCKTKDGKFTQREIQLDPADEKTTATIRAKAALAEPPAHYEPHFLARMPAPASTTYIYVDAKGSEFRLFMGKRGAMKRLTIKEIVDDNEAMILVTAKGTLTAKKRQRESDTSHATFGTAKKPAVLEVQSPLANRKLIYRDLGVYTREPSENPCYEL